MEYVVVEMKSKKTPLKKVTPDRGLEYQKAREDFLSEEDKKSLSEAKTVEEEENKFSFPWQEPGVS